MSFGILHFKKLHSGDLKGVSSHHMRAHESKSNPDIDYVRTQNNDVFLSAEHLELRVNQRIKELNLKRLRKDAVTCVDAVIEASPEFYENANAETQRNFFKDSFDFIKNVFGVENVMYGILHRDEAGSTHLHVGFVPVTPDGRLCAKEIISRGNLFEFQDKFFAEVSQKYGLERGVSAKEKRAKGEKYFKKHMETAEYKYYKEVTERLEKYASRESEVKEITARASKKLLSDKYTLSGQDFRRLATIAKTGAVAEHQVRELTRENKNLKKGIAARDDKIEYEHSVNDALRDKVKRASLYLNADAGDRQQVDAYLAAREKQHRAEKWARLSAGVGARSGEGDKKNRALVSEAEKEREDNEKLMRSI